MTDLDLSPIEARVAADGAAMRAGYQIYRADVATLLTEVRRLRADRDHARAWASYWLNTGTHDPTGDSWPFAGPRPASDGWDGGSASFAAPDREGTR